MTSEDKMLVKTENRVELSEEQTELWKAIFGERQKISRGFASATTPVLGTPGVGRENTVNDGGRWLVRQRHCRW